MEDDYKKFIRELSDEYLYKSDFEDVESFIETKDFESYGVEYETVVFDVTMFILEQDYGYDE
jgi:hypothetical protein